MSHTGFLLQENGDQLLQENGDGILLDVQYGISGICTLTGSPVTGAIVTLIRSSDDTIVDTYTTGADGVYEFLGLDQAELYHVVAEYEDAPDQYNAKSLPFVTPVR